MDRGAAARRRALIQAKHGKKKREKKVKSKTVTTGETTTQEAVGGRGAYRDRGLHNFSLVITISTT